MSIALEEMDSGKGVRQTLYSYLWARLFVVLALAVSFVYFLSHHPQWSNKLLTLYLVFTLYMLGCLILMRVEERERFLLLHFLADTLVISYLYTFYPLTGVPFSIFFLFPLFMGGLVLAVHQVVLLDVLIVVIFLGISVANGESALFIVLHLFSFVAVVLASFFMRRDVALAEKEKEEARRWRELYRAVADYIPAGLVVMDEKGIIRAMNPRAVELLGGKVEGEPAVKYFPFLGDMEEDVAERMEGELVGASGKKVPVGYTIARFAQESRLMIFTDLTKIKKLEEEQRRSSFMAMLGRMSADLAHDMRNPLGAIRGAAEVLKEITCQDRDFGELLDIIASETERLDALVSEFLVFATPTVTSRKKVPVDLVAMVREILERPSFKGRVNLETSHDSLVVLGQKIHLERVVKNLVQNALDADVMGRGVKVSIRGTEKEVEIVVEDRGEGIPQEFLTEVFRPFFSTKSQGIGLGLSICQKIVEEHGGKIYLDSQVGEGTVVTVVLPRGEGNHGDRGEEV